MQRKRHTLPPLVIGALLLLLASTGCTSTRIASQPVDFDTINRHAETKKAHVTLKSGLSTEGRDLRISGDFVSWASPRSGEITTVSMADVTEVSFTRHARGALHGAGIGFAAGALSLGVIGAVSPCEGWVCFGPGAYAVMGGVLGIPFGTLNGARAGSKLKFVIRPHQINEMPVVAAEDEGR